MISNKIIQKKLQYYERSFTTILTLRCKAFLQWIIHQKQ